jgi:hypothetical protein
MAPASWIQRMGAACAAVVIGLALLTPPPSLAAPERAGGSPSHEIGDAGSTLAGVVPSPTKRSAEGPFVLFGVVVAPQAAASPTRGLRLFHAGTEAPALTRWRIAHGTSTSSP